MATPLGNHARRLGPFRALRTVKGRREQGLFAIRRPDDARRGGRRGRQNRPTLRDAARIRFHPASARTAGSGYTGIRPYANRGREHLRRGNPHGNPSRGVDPPQARRGALHRSATLAGAGRPQRSGQCGDAACAPPTPSARAASFSGRAASILIIQRSYGRQWAPYCDFRWGLPRLPNSRRRPRQAGATVLGLATKGVPIARERWQGSCALIVGNERHGLGEWEALCERILSVPIRGRAESLSAGVAGSIALYQATLGGVLE